MGEEVVTVVVGGESVVVVGVIVVVVGAIVGVGEIVVSVGEGVVVIGMVGVVATAPLFPPALLPFLPPRNTAAPPTRTPANKMQVNGCREHWSVGGLCKSTPFTVRTEAHPAIDSASTAVIPIRASWRIGAASPALSPRRLAERGSRVCGQPTTRSSDRGQAQRVAHVPPAASFTLMGHGHCPAFGSRSANGQPYCFLGSMSCRTSCLRTRRRPRARSTSRRLPSARGCGRSSYSGSEAGSPWRGRLFSSGPSSSWRTGW